MLSHSQLKESRSFSQRGINMVDLMMWLVIAALLLAAAIQGIGYYQKSALLYSMKSDSVGVADLTLAQSSQQEGTITDTVLTTAIADAKLSGQDTAASGTAFGEKVIVISNVDVSDVDVVYFFEATNGYNVGPNIVPKGSITPVSDSGSGGDSAGGDTSTGGGTTVTGNEYVNAKIVQLLNEQMAVYGSPEFLAANTGGGDPDYWSTDPKVAAFNETDLFVSNDRLLTTEMNNMLNNPDQVVRTAYDSYYAAYITFATELTSETQSAWMDATVDYYQTAIDHAGEQDMSVAAYSGSALSQTVAAGSTTPVVYRFSLPDSAPNTVEIMNVYTDNNNAVINDITTDLNLTITRTDTAITDGSGKRYYEVTLTPGSGGFAAGTGNVFIHLATPTEDTSWEQKPMYPATLNLNVTG